ncbi:MAG: hypothetical protein HZB91_03895 [Elusimicrobia bacterium]|nr:hypothetical protein [Elusimicrobiota bacterium]
MRDNASFPSSLPESRLPESSPPEQAARRGVRPGRTLRSAAVCFCLLAAGTAPAFAGDDGSRARSSPASFEDLNGLFDGLRGRLGARDSGSGLATALEGVREGSGFKDRKCAECHRQFVPGTQGLHPIIDSWGCDACHVDAHTRPQKRYKWLVADPQELCVRCHAGKGFKGPVQHAPAKMRLCVTCHDPHVSAKKKLLVSEPPLLCFDCHKQEAFFRKVRHSPAADGSCLDCHLPHSGDNPKLLVDKKVCFNCHDEAGIMGKKVIHAPVKALRCAGCHDPHSSSREKLLVSDKLCFTCHKPEAFQGVSVHYPVKSGGCDSCHQPHQSDTPKLLSETVPGLCFTCHDETEFKGKKVVHYPVASGECTSCHSPHAGAAPFLMATEKICFECHDEKEFDGTGKHIKADPRWCVGCHNPHQSDNGHLLRKK